MQKKIVQQQSPHVRRIFTTSSAQQQQQQSTMQLNAVKKINSLLQSGTVSVTGITHGQQRVVQKKPLLAQPTSVSITTTNTNSYASRQQKCYICGENAGLNATLMSEASTSTTQTEYVAKLAKVIGPNYSVVLSVEDVICRRCITILNQLDKLGSEMDNLRSTLLGFIHKKNNIPEDGAEQQQQQQVGGGSPPAKMQKLTHVSTAGSGGTTAGGVTYSIKGADSSALNTSGGSGSELNTSADVEAQLTSLFEKGSSGGAVTQQSQQKHIVVTTNNGGTASVTINAQGSTTPVAAAGTNAAGGGLQRKASKLYKCMPCGFKTTDLALFQPHYENCPPRAAGGGGVAAQSNAASPTAASNAGSTSATGTVTTTTTTFRCKMCKTVFGTIALLKQHTLQEHPTLQQQQQQHSAVQKTIVVTTGAGGAQELPHQILQCGQCSFKTADKQVYNEHIRKHGTGTATSTGGSGGGTKLKPFKCRVCLQRFESREMASLHAKQHQPDYFKCGICNVTFNKRELLMTHLEQHENMKKDPNGSSKPQQQQQQQHVQQLQLQTTTATAQQQQQMKLEMADSSTQKLLQESIDEALRDSMGDPNNAKIQFHSCESCSLTFLSEKLYTQHMKTHVPGGGGGGGAGGAGTPGIVTTGLGQQQQQQQLVVSSNTVSSAVAAAGNRKPMGGVTSALLLAATADGGSGGLAGKLLATTGSSNSASTAAASAQSASDNTISDGDLESIFERMHSDPKVSESSDHPTATGAVSATEAGSMVITSQDGTTGNITFNITLPQQDDGSTAFVQQQQHQEQQQSVGIDMPTLDQGDEQQQQQQKEQQHMPVSMPSLDDDGEQSQNSQNSNTENVPMELEDMQGADGQQIKFILNESGQLLQLDNNHIITTDAEGNQILVQGADSEHIQQLLQSVGVVMQGSEGETLQMLSSDGQNQMILVRGADGQEQLIDASLLNADGNIVIQQQQEGELNAEGTHITTEDGLQIPVSVAFTTSGEVDQEGHLTVSMAEGSEQQLQLHLEQAGGGSLEEQQQHEQQHLGDGSVDHQQQQQQQHNAILTEGGQIIIHQKEHDEHSEKDHDGENGPTGVDDGSEGSGHGQTVVTTTNGADGSTVVVTTYSSSPNGTTITTTSTTAPATTTNANSTESAEDQMFNFDELIQPQIVIKQQQVRN
uniref:C2H2-type domain-containing protein n=1 Tax=Anopheles atroparvus TaxID=41427 RepID=A0AAG5D6B9_ANOAO